MAAAKVSRFRKREPLMLLIFVGRRGRKMIGQIFEEREVRLPMLRNMVLVMQYHVPQFLQLMHVEPGDHRRGEYQWEEQDGE